MSHPSEHPFRTLQFYTTGPYPCSYLDQHEARSLVASPGHLVNGAVYSALIEEGFRRSGLFTYRPQCEQCQACVPIRVDVDRFKASRTQNKVWHRHAKLQTSRAPLVFNDEHFALYRRYVASRHKDGDMDIDDQSQYSQFLLHSRVDTNLIEFRDPDGALKIVSIIDIVANGLSAVYTFFDPADSGSLGTYAILWQIDRCKIMRRPWLYLGYWIQESRKMAYKTRYKPYQTLHDGAWKDIQS